MHAAFGMYLRLAEIAPPSAHAVKSELLVAVAQPCAGVGIRYVKHTSLSDPYSHFLGRAGGVGKQETFVAKRIVIVGSTAVAQYIGL